MEPENGPNMVGAILVLLLLVVTGPVGAAHAQVLTESPDPAAPGTSVTGSWSGIGSPTLTDWIGLFPENADDHSYTTWVFTSSCTQTAGANALAAGSCSIPLVGATAGNRYQLRLFAADGFTRLAVSPSFLVTSATLSESPNPAPSNGSATGSWSNVSPAAVEDWIGLFPAAGDDHSYIFWLYTSSCTQSAGANALAAGSCNVPMSGTIAGNNYQLRLFSNDSFNRVASSATFSVSKTGNPAMRATDFLNTLGLTSHVVQGQTSPAQLQAGIQYLGVRHDRDDYTADEFDSRHLIANVFCPIHVQAGVTYDALPYASGNVTDQGGTKLEWDELATCGALSSLEGPNEPNNQPFQYKGVDCNEGTTFQGCANFQHDLYALAKFDSLVSSLPMFSITEVGAEPDNVGLQFLSSGGTFADFANLHNYVVGNNGVLQDNRAWTAEAPGSSEQCCFDGMDGEFINSTWSKHFAASPAGTDIRRVTTETGWASGQGGISEAKRGTVLTNVYLSAAKRGWSYTFIYQLKDDVDSFGLYDSSFNPKLAATYIHNLTTILADTSSAFTPTPLAYSIANEPVTVHDLLMQKSDGSYGLAVWGDQVTGSNSVTVTLPQTYASVKVYDITLGTSPVTTLSNVSMVPLTLSDHARIVTFGP